MCFCAGNRIISTTSIYQLDENPSFDQVLHAGPMATFTIQFITYYLISSFRNFVHNISVKSPHDMSMKKSLRRTIHDMSPFRNGEGGGGGVLS